MKKCYKMNRFCVIMTKIIILLVGMKGGGGGIGYLWQIQRVLQLYGFEKQRILARCDFWAWRKVKLAKYLANAIFWLFITVMTVTCLLQILDKK